MKSASHRRVSNPVSIDLLERRTFLCASALVSTAVEHVQHAAIMAEAKTPSLKTQTTVKATAGTVGQPISITVTVKAAKAEGSPIGTVDITANGTMVGETTLAPISSTSKQFAFSHATFTISGDSSMLPYVFKRAQVAATFTSSASLLSSTGKAFFNVKHQGFASKAGGLKIVTFGAGTGAKIKTGQTATMTYTGVLAATGTVFDASANHSPGTFSFVVNATPEQVISGFDQGAVGMKVGQTRVLYIPYALGYGASGYGPIPPAADLIFEITLVSIS